MGRTIAVRERRGENVAVKPVGRASLAGVFFRNFFTGNGREDSRNLWGLFSEDKEIVKRSVVRLGERRVERAVPLLHGMFVSETDASAREKVVEALVSIGRRDSALVLLTCFVSEGDVLVRRKIAESLGDFGEKLGETEVTLRKARDAGVPEALMAKAAAEAGASDGDARATLTYKRVIASFLRGVAGNKEDDAFVRLYSINSIGKLKDSEATPLLIGVCLDENEDMRRRAAAVNALKRIGDARAGREFIAYLRSTRKASQDKLVVVARMLAVVATEADVEGITNLLASFESTEVGRVLTDALKAIEARRVSE